MNKALSIRFLLYEFIGVTLMTIAYNMSYSFVSVVFVVSIWAWDLSAAHFNMAISLGAFIYGTDK